MRYQLRQQPARDWQARAAASAPQARTHPWAGHPLPRALSGSAEFHEWWDATDDCFRIDVRITNPIVGPVFGYRGRFTARYVDTSTAPVPAAVKPLRERADPWTNLLRRAHPAPPGSG
jgi:hypothetical protein